MAVNLKGEEISANTVVKSVASNVAWACSIVDTAPAEMNPKTYAAAIKKAFPKTTNVMVKEISGAKLLQEKLGGIHAVGRCATEAPRLLILDYNPRGSKKTVGIAGKGVTYDSGGLSLKISGSMVGMKTDLGGSAAVVAAFKALVETKVKTRVIAALGIVENAIGPDAFRNDDILEMHSVRQ